MSGEEGVIGFSPINKRLLGKTMQPTQRRGSFYQNLKTQQQPVIPPPINNNNVEVSSKKVFRAIHGRIYNGVSIEKPEKTSEKLNNEKDYKTPIFLDGEGNFYNLYYQKLDIEKLSLEKFPDPENSVSYTNFEQNVVQWYNKTQQILTSLQLPLIMGRAYYRPKIGMMELHNSVDLSEKLEKGEIGSSGSQSISTVDDPDMFDIEYDKRWNLDRDVWQAMLFPPEPIPDYYKTFDAYEESLKNWAYICSTIIPLLPPHPSQLQDLLLLKTGEQRKKETEIQRGKTKTIEKKGGGSIDAIQTNKIFTGVHLPKPLAKDQKQHKEADKKSIDLSFNHTILPPDADEATINKCSTLFGNLSDTRIESMDYNGYYSPPISGKFRQIYPHNPMFFESEINQSQGVRSSTNLPLFRVDHQPSANKTLYQHLFDLENLEFSDEFSKPFSFSFFAHFYRQFNSDKMTSARNILLDMEKKFQLDRLCAWFHSLPSSSLSSAEFCEKYSVQSIKLYLEIFLTSCPDSILDLLLEPYASGESFLESLVSRLSNQQIVQILHYLFLVQRENARANVALFFYQVMQTSISSSLLTFIIDANDLLSLYLLSYCMNYFSPSMVDIYPTNHQLLETIKYEDESKLGLLSLIFKHYYLHSIKKVIDQNNLFFTSLSEQFSLIYNNSEEAIKSGFQINPGFLSQLFKMINHRSHSTSHFALVLLLFLLEHSFSHEYLLLPTSNLLNNARALFSSKFSHTKFAAKRIFEVINKVEVFKEALLALYEDNSLFLSDLTSTTNGGPSELSNFTLGICKELDDVIARGISHRTMSSYPFFFVAGREKANFFILLRQIFRDKDCNSPANLNVSIAMAQIIKSYRKLRLLEAKEENQLDESTLSPTLLYVIPDDVMNILSHISDSSSTSDISYQIKTNLLYCVCELMTMPVIFRGISENKSFFTKVIRICKEAEGLQCNKAAWRIFYTMIKFHAGSPIILENSKYLSQFLDLISPTMSNVTITNCFYYITKILNLFESENGKFEDSKKCVRGNIVDDLKTIEKDIKSFNSTFVKYAVKAHWIYKKLLFNHISGFPLHSVIHFYQTVYAHKSNQNTGGNKIYKELTKNKDYKLQVDQIVALFGSFPPEKSFGVFSIAPVKRGTISIKLNK